MPPHCTALALALCSLAQAPPKPPADLADYVRKPDPSFAWTLAGKTETEAGTVYDLRLVSQTWHGIKWEHDVQIYMPAGAKPTSTVVLWNQGGRPGASSGLLGLLLARNIKAPVVFLYGVPNQPLFDGKKEDALIAETFVRYLETKDPTWPLLFPMVKSVTAAMDAVQAFAAKEWNGHKVTGFVVTGASKRGWTSWLTAASGDPRVKAIAPLVIDTLNMPVQMLNQVRAFGRPSEMIRDYVERKLTPIPDSPEAKKLWRMIDPWVYRVGLTMPKLVINGANDPYWPLDALNSYWDDLPGEKHLLYVPNAGHDLRERDTDGKPDALPTRTVNTITAFCRSVIFGKPMPKMEWVNADQNGRAVLSVAADRPARKVRVWRADADTRDFRKARWESAELAPAGGTASYRPECPGTGFRAVFAEAEFDQDGFTFPLSTQLRILDAK